MKDQATLRDKDIAIIGMSGRFLEPKISQRFGVILLRG